MGGVFPDLGQQDKNPLQELKIYENVEAKRLELRLRLNESATIDKVEATADGQALPVEYVPFGAEGKPDTCALLFLIDKSE
jgi:hypothetical protein